ncbi:type II toxin-antitoxin system RelE/ParE family toxin [Paracoccus aestuariivivens]|uniref:Toxin n=1 Tax=Paracoccus aestuariivivens TaxID=1820333 RepID=A0A6L6JFS5_9RHOB|nr:type II toxin-antitoxin system RelE/ParE family toxin [Paracoccus aestuariivivens]MTH80135.1 type II toxin-antitoxin system RelE/ParE family toxin [Paracoccus aestuariivivens]
MTGERLCILRLTSQAEADLEEIWLYGESEWSAAQADRYVDGLMAVLNLLCDMPGIARERMEFRPLVRIHPSGSHLIIYRMEEGGNLDVLRILGGCQNWRRLLEVLE